MLLWRRKMQNKYCRVLSNLHQGTTQNSHWHLDVTQITYKTNIKLNELIEKTNGGGTKLTKQPIHHLWGVISK